MDELEKAPDGTYDRMLVDIQMPNMDGYKAAKIIRRLPEEESGYPHPHHDGQCLCNGSEKALEMGMNGHIAKPINGEKIQGALAPILMEKGAKG